MSDVGRALGCLAQINSNSFIITGGLTSSGYDRAMLRHDIDSGTWTDLPKPTVGRAQLICGHIDGTSTLPWSYKHA